MAVRMLPWRVTAFIGSVLVQAELPFSLCEFAPAALTKYCLLRALNTRTSFSHSFGGEKPQIKMLAGLISSLRGLFPWLAGLLEAVFPSYLHVVFPASVSVS